MRLALLLSGSLAVALNPATAGASARMEAKKFNLVPRAAAATALFE